MDGDPTVEAFNLDEHAFYLEATTASGTKPFKAALIESPLSNPNSAQFEATVSTLSKGNGNTRGGEDAQGPILEHLKSLRQVVKVAVNTQLASLLVLDENTKFGNRNANPLSHSAIAVLLFRIRDPKVNNFDQFVYPRTHKVRRNNAQQLALEKLKNSRVSIMEGTHYSNEPSPIGPTFVPMDNDSQILPLMASSVKEDNHSLVKSIVRGIKERRRSSMKLSEEVSLVNPTRGLNSLKLSNNFDILAEPHNEEPLDGEIDRNKASNDAHDLAIVSYDKSKMSLYDDPTKPQPLESDLETRSLSNDLITKEEQSLGHNQIMESKTKDYDILIPARNGLFTKVKWKRGRPKGKQTPLPKCFDSFKAAKDIIS
ncbi:hypothetical protein SUGI_0849560 [Cryptomeria japonica]|nr:hypothetical protein SUGI_0849560 [Cryptomeria japonica]